MHNDYTTIANVLEEGKSSVEAMGGEVVAVVGDNHSGPQLGIDKIVEKYPRIFKIKCAAHSFQACFVFFACFHHPSYLQSLMKDLTKVNPFASACRLGEAILIHFEDVDQAKKLQDVQEAAKVKPLKLIKPVATRWVNVFCGEASPL